MLWIQQGTIVTRFVEALLTMLHALLPLLLLIPAQDTTAPVSDDSVSDAPANPWQAASESAVPS